jgi:hypothetical protein
VAEGQKRSRLLKKGPSGRAGSQKRIASGLRQTTSFIDVCRRLRNGHSRRQLDPGDI